MLYLLDVNELLQIGGENPLWEELVSYLDETRKEKVLRMQKAASAKTSCVGAGLILAYGVQRFLEDNRLEEGLENVSVQQIRAYLKERPKQNLLYEIGPEGKPAFIDPTLPQFNLSHSGCFVALSLAKNPVGVDVQVHKKQDIARLEERFFHASERGCSLSEFYRLWTRKEAWGKCEGIGVRPALEKSFLDLEKDFCAQYHWFEMDCLGSDAKNYSICVCTKRHEVV